VSRDMGPLRLLAGGLTGPKGGALAIVGVGLRF
jgi:hypothetical protein